MSHSNYLRQKLKERKGNFYEDEPFDKALIDYLDEHGTFITRYDEDYGGRFHKYDIRIYAFTEGEETVHFMIRETVGLTELQSNEGFDFFEVKRFEKVVVDYKNVN